MKVKYISEDNKEFHSEEECKTYETLLADLKTRELSPIDVSSEENVDDRSFKLYIINDILDFYLFDADENDLENEHFYELFINSKEIKEKFPMKIIEYDDGDISNLESKIDELKLINDSLTKNIIDNNKLIDKFNEYL